MTTDVDIMAAGRPENSASTIPAEVRGVLRELLECAEVVDALASGEGSVEAVEAVGHRMAESEDHLIQRVRRLLFQ